MAVMDTDLIERARDLVASGRMTKSGLARAAGLHANTLRDMNAPEWNPTSDTLKKLQRVLDSGTATSTLVPIEEIIEEARNGRMYILVDDEDRENEGDLVIPAQMATPQAINFMATHGKGLICLSLTKERTEAMGLQLMARANGTRHETAFTTSIEAAEGVTTGISAADRARTISVAINSQNPAEDIVTPGHVFPLIAREGGVLVRAGHTEAAVDISRLAGLNPSGVICEIMRADGDMARMDDLMEFAREHRLKIGTIRDLIEFRRRNDHLVDCIAEADFTSDYGGDWRLLTYLNRVDGTQHLVLQKGRVHGGSPTLVRMHALSLYSDTLGLPGSRKRLLQRSMQQMAGENSAIIVVLMPAVAQGLASMTKREKGSGDEDLRDYGIGAQILADLGVSEMTLMTTSHKNIVGLDGYGIEIVGERLIAEED
jgi:3,4-dihydroxy 2-butanone 4-phosphate synthase/GTP cyclohydrolase II|tara:strand:+ start:158243 stop:159529 length:1287 start_codon:yes stop_codon:yes gene_type:complete